VHLYIYHLYVVRVNKSCAVDRQLIQEELAVQGIQSGLHYPIPCHLQQAFRHLDYQVGDLSQAETLCQEVLSLPMYPGLSNAQIHQVVAALGPIKMITLQKF
jgi:dTDP-4-amino-4,6-dideoxygalactose transaminase